MYKYLLSMPSMPGAFPGYAATTRYHSCSKELIVPRQRSGLCPELRGGDLHEKGLIYLGARGHTSPAMRFSMVAGLMGYQPDSRMDRNRGQPRRQPTRFIWLTLRKSLDIRFLVGSVCTVIHLCWES